MNTRDRRPRVILLLLAMLLLLVPTAGATWSILLIDTATGEIGIAGATCLEGLDLRKLLPVLVVSKGGAVAQSQIDNGAVNRKKIFAQLKLGTPPAQIIEIALEGDLFKKSRQYGVIDLSPAAAGYTGTSAFAYKQDVTGSFGTISYAIQGNVLTGAPVITAAVDAVTLTPGSLADKLIAGMQAARAMGGDGRCSCEENDPTGCGSPPVNGFIKSAHIGFMLLSRAGDVDGICNALVGCASGSYWLNLNVPGQLESDPDPVLQLQQQYDAFVAASLGHPDGVRSLAAFDAGDVLGDGTSTRELLVGLYDIEGAAITHGGATLTVAHAPESAGLSTLVGVLDHGDGTYTLQIMAGAGEGTDVLAVSVDDGVKPATLFPYPTLLHRRALLADVTELSALGGGAVTLDLLGPSAASGRGFVMRLSAAGTVPGQTLPGGLLVPLNFDRLFVLSPALGAAGVLQGSPGALDGSSHGLVRFAPGAANLAPLTGMTLAAAFTTVRPTDFASNAVEFQIVP